MDRQAWRDFFITLFLLGLSFVIAVLSSIAAQQNAIRLGAVSAAVSLVLAVIGAVYILPRLARRVQLEFIRFAVRTTVTVEGLFFFALLVVIGFAAWNTANNLLYLILSAMISFLFAANFISRLSMSDLSIQLRFPDHIFAGEQARLAIAVSNHKRLLPTFSIIVEPLADSELRPKPKSLYTKSDRGQRLPQSGGTAGESVAAKAAATAAATAIDSASSGAPSGAMTVVAHGHKKKEQGQQKPTTLGKLAHFILVPAGATAKQRIEHRFEKRGCYPITAFRVSTKFPTGFFKKWRRIEAVGEIVVYPKPKPLDDFYHALPMIAGIISSFARGSGDDLFRIRRYYPSDHMRNIDWKATAKSRNLMVRDHTREDERRLTIVFDTSRPSASKERQSQVDASAPTSGEKEFREEKPADRFEQSFEAAIVMAASLANHFILEGSDVELITARPEASVESAKGMDHLYDILRVLATLQPDSPQTAGGAAGDNHNRERTVRRHARFSETAQAPGGASNGAVHVLPARSLWQMVDEIPILADERRFKVLITSAGKGTIPANIWRSAHVVFMEDLK